VNNGNTLAATELDLGIVEKHHQPEAHLSDSHEDHMEHEEFTPHAPFSLSMVFAIGLHQVWEQVLVLSD
jgi:hypothetical protein